MNRLLRVVALGSALSLSLVALAGCPRRTSPSTGEGEGGGGGGAVPAGKALAVTFDGRELVFKYGAARLNGKNGNLHVFLSTEPLPCTTPQGEELSKGGQVLEWSVPAGQAARYFAGDTVGIALAARERGPSQLGVALPLPPTASMRNLTRLRLSPFRQMVGERVRGSLELGAKSTQAGKVVSSAGAGSFDVELCEIAVFPGQLPMAEGAPDTPVAGRVAGLPFVPKSALAELGHDADNDLTFIDQLVFYPDADVTCAMHKDADAGAALREKTAFRLERFGGTDSKHPALGVAEPASKRVVNRNGKEPVEAAGGDSWVSFSQLAYNPGDQVKGALGVASFPREAQDFSATLTGTLTATVCK